MKRLFLEPIDVLMFRSERPFVARETHVAKTGAISPLTFEGAIKSKILSEFCKIKGYSLKDFQRMRRRDDTEDFEGELSDSLKQMMNDNEIKKLLEVIGYSPLGFSSKLKVLGIFFAKKDEFMEYFQIPNDIVKEDKENGKIVKLQPKESFQFKWMNKDIWIGVASHSQVESIDSLMNFNGLKEYLKGGCPKPVKIEYRGKKLRKPYFKEIRSGIELEKGKKQTVEGALYTAEFLRVIENWGFLIWYECPDDFLLTEGLIKLGGEGKGAILKPIEDMKIDWSDLIKRINEEKKFKLYLATPSYFNGCVPPQEELKKLLGVEVELVAAFPGKAVYIGGYDFALNIEKPLKRWVNAGAVYYYKFNKFNGKINERLSLPIKIIDIEKNIDMRCAFIGVW